MTNPPDNQAAIIFTRMDSSRLPEKALTIINGRPLLDYVVANCKASKAFGHNIIIATSDRPIDDPIEDYAKLRNLKIFRGSLENVAGRATAAAQHFNLEVFCRVMCDSPFWPYNLADHGMDMMNLTNSEFVTNLSPRSFPYGVAVEIIRTSLMEKLLTKDPSQEEREHFTTYIYKHPDDFRIANITRKGKNLHHIRLTIDTKEDLIAFKSRVKDHNIGKSPLDYTRYIPQ